MTPTVLTIKRHVAACFGISMTEMESRRQCQQVARPRQVAMYLAKHLTHHSFPEIGHAFGGRDHTTVMHGVSRIEALMARDPAFARRVNDVMTGMPPNPDVDTGSVPEDMDKAAHAARLEAVRRAKTDPGAGVAGRPEDLRWALSKLYGERVCARGTARDGGGVELLVSEGGAWSLIGIAADGDRACLIEAGRDWSGTASGDRTRPPVPLKRSHALARRERPCLKCGGGFLSDGPGNRICATCRPSLARLDTGLAEGAIG